MTKQRILDERRYNLPHTASETERPPEIGDFPEYEIERFINKCYY